MRQLTESQQLLGDAEWTLSEFLHWPTKHHYTMGALWLAAASLRDSGGDFKPYAIGRPLFTSEMGNTGKSLSTRLMCAMTPGGEMVVNATAYGIQAILNAKGCPGMEEFDKRLGARAARNLDVLAIILAGYTQGPGVIRERNDKVDRVNVTGPLVLNGNNANMILHHASYQPVVTRSHVFLLEEAPEDVAEVLTEFNPELHDARLAAMRRRFKQWGTANWATICATPIDSLGMDKRIRNRQKEIWTVLYRVAHFVGGEWPARCQAAARAIVLGVFEDEDTPVISSTEEMLWAVRATFSDGDTWLSTDEILARLVELPQRPKLLDEWGTPRAAEMGLARVLRVFGVEHERKMIDGEREWGYSHASLYEDGQVPVVQ